ncbi:pyridoxamine 5'-phosphate oxidase family protein [Cryobacterium tagatosivorans]|uniref:Pyridoxamine 5-phosphate oxidase n=1 Tax=Cryobacterium tagatosivorans TaxID=1259199 RepID=A0A4R8UC90_9MICO|nr:pyridoxamine 5'-phosphate oxidase family protein [Cryobacterium tagatosivorans]TFB48972.1 pyridoxamine 5-phosphate oxidase [Cryobacterium tagatosivorans]
MAAWTQVESEAPGFASRVRERFDSGTNKTMATVRTDGAPRISGTEVAFREGRITLGMMPGSVKLQDVRRDPRVAIHSPTIEPPAGKPSDWPGDAKIAGRLIDIAPLESEPPGSSCFEVDVSEVVLTYVDGSNTRLVIEGWHDGRGWTTRSRA